MYKIKPLEWIESINWEGKQQFDAKTSRGYYRITASEWMGEPMWYWEYCFSEYYDEGSGYISGMESAKQYCENLWLARMEADLIAV